MRSFLSFLISLGINGILIGTLFLLFQQPPKQQIGLDQELFAWEWLSEVPPPEPQNVLMTEPEPEIQHEIPTDEKTESNKVIPEQAVNKRIPKCAPDPDASMAEKLVFNPDPDCPPEAKAQLEREQQRLEQERREREKQQRLEQERREREKQQRLEQERRERERQQRLESEQKRRTQADNNTQQNNLFDNINYAGKTSQQGRGQVQGSGQSTQSGNASGGKSNKQNPQAGQSSGTSAHAMNAYTRGLRIAIERNKHYPRRAERMGVTGTVIVAFTVQANGKISNARLQQSSGNSSLDQAAIEAVTRTGHYQPTPNGQNLGLSVPINFKKR